MRLFLIFALALHIGAVATVSVAHADDNILRYATKGLPINYGNPYRANGTPSNFIWLGIFDALTRLDPDGNLVPALATSWQNVDPNTWQFKLRQNVTFSNGEPFTSEAVVAAITWLKTDEGRRSIIGNEVRNIASAQAIDDHTVLIRTDLPDAILPNRLNAMLIVAPTAWADLGPDAYAKDPAGTGSFVVTDWGDTSGVAELIARKDSWRPPHVDGVQMTNLPDNAARIQALLAGQVDIAGNINIDDIELVDGLGFSTVNAPIFGVMSLTFRLEEDRDTPLRDIRVRQALNYAVDKQAIADALLLGVTVPGGQPAGQLTFGHNPEIEPYPYDPDKARALLSQAGYPDGFDLTFAVMIERVPGDSAIYQTVANYLSQIGVRLELQTVTFPTWINNYLPGTWNDNIDGFTLSWNALPYNDVLRPMEYFSCLKAVPFYCDQALTAKIVAAAAVMEEDLRRDRLFDLAQEFHTRAPSLFLVEMFDLFAHAPHVSNLKVANKVVMYENVRLNADD
jgi:peptide/nickel transport system substrate-binding protein